MARARYLADTSVIARLTKPAVDAVFTPLTAAGQVALCAPVRFELGFWARSKADYAKLTELAAAFPGVPTTDADHERAVEVQAALSSKSQQRGISLVDGLVAAIAEARELVVLHYDADFETIAKVTGQPHEWIVERGTAD